LEELNLSRNYITHITEELYVLTNLRKLDLSHNLIRFIAPRGIENLKKLEYFNLEDNLLSELPFGLGEILNLKELNIMENLFVSCFSYPHYTLAKNGTKVKVQWEKLTPLERIPICRLYFLGSRDSCMYIIFYFGRI